MSASSRTKHARRRGLSFVELVIVLLVLGIVVAVATPRWARQLETYRASAAAHRIAGDVERVQSLAYSTSSSQTIVFDVGQDQYRIDGLSDPDRPAEVYTVRLNDTPYQSRIISADFDGQQQLAFNGFGLPVGGGRIVVQSGSVQRTVVVDGSSGKASVQ